MTALFLHLVNLSITAGWVVLAILLVRLLFRRMPKALSCALWGLAALRLVLPFSLQSVLSLIPSRETIPQTVLSDPVPQIESGVPFVNSTVNDFFVARAASPALPAVAAAAPGLTLTQVLSVVWLVGMCSMLFYALISTALLRRRVRASIRLHENVFLCDDVKSPFVFGVLRPRIYLPSSLPSAQIPLVLAHEQAHLRRCDHLWKPLGFLLLSVYWFHPLLWVAYLLFCRDLELACDERVAKGMPNLDRAAYSQALLDCGSGRHLYLTMPLAFGEVGIKQRVKAVLSYKKPTLWVLIGAILVSSVLAVCFLTDPKEKPGPSADGRVTVLESTGNDSRVRLDVKELSFGPNGLSLTADWVNNGDDPIVFGEEFLVSRQDDADHAVTCDAKQELVWTAIAYVVNPGGRTEKTYPLSLYDCDGVGTYWFTMEYQHENEKGERWGQGQVTVKFEIRDPTESAAETPEVQLLQTTCASDEIGFRVKKLFFDAASVTAPLKAEVEWTNLTEREITVPASYNLLYTDAFGSEELECSEGYVFPQTLTALQPHRKLTQTLALSEAYPCTLPGAYECRLWTQFSDSLLLSSTKGQEVSFCFRIEAPADALPTATGRGPDQSPVRLLPARLQFDGTTLLTEVLFVNHDERKIEAQEEQWILRREKNGMYVSVPANQTADERQLFFTLEGRSSKAYGYGPTLPFACASPGDYRFQVHYRFEDDPADAYPRVMWFDYTIPDDASAPAASEDPVQELDSSCGLEGVKLKLSDYDLTNDGLTLHLVCRNDSGADVMLRGDVMASVSVGGYILGRVTKTDAHWHRLGGLGTEEFTVFVDANEYSAIVPDGISCLTGETFDMGPLLQSGVWNLTLSCREPGKGQARQSAVLRLLVTLPQAAQEPFSAMEPGDCGSEKASLAVEDPCVSVGEENVFFSMQLANHSKEAVKVTPDFSLFDNKTDRRIPLSTDHESRMNKQWTIEPDCGSGASNRIPVKDLTALPAGTYRVEQEIENADGSRFCVWMVFTLLPETLRLQARNAAYMNREQETILTQELLRRAGYAGTQTESALQIAAFACYGKNDTKDGSVTYSLSALTRHVDEDDVAESTNVVAVTLRHSDAGLYYTATDYKVLGKGHETDGSVVSAKVYRAIAEDKETPALLQLAGRELTNRAQGSFYADETPQPQIHPSVYPTYDASEGLTVYVWKMSENNTRYGLLPGPPYRHTLYQKTALTGVSREQMLEILDGHKIDKAKIQVRIFQQPYSDYWWEYDDNQLVDQRYALGLQ